MTFQSQNSILESLIFHRGGNPPKPPFCLFSYPPEGLRGLNFVASKRYHFKKRLKLVNKKGTIWDFSFSLLKPPKIKPPFMPLHGFLS